MPRPTDWDVLGLDRDPVPGEPDKVAAIATWLGDLQRAAEDVLRVFTTVMAKAGPEAFAGETADALREAVAGRGERFVKAVAEAAGIVAGVCGRYAPRLRELQAEADGALAQARGLPKDDPQRQALADKARTAGHLKDEFAKSLVPEVERASEMLKQPMPGCAAFWEIFKWLALALIVPALLFGGPAWGVFYVASLVGLAKSYIDVLQNKPGAALELLLWALNFFAPTTRAVPFNLLFKGAGNLLASGARGAWNGLTTLFASMRTGFTTIVKNPFILLPGLKDLVGLHGWFKGGALWVRNGITNMPAWAGTTIRSGGLAVVHGVQGIWSSTVNLSSAAWRLAKYELGGDKWLVRMTLPIDVFERQVLGTAGAWKLSLWNRGVLGQHPYGLQVSFLTGRFGQIGLVANHLTYQGFDRIATIDQLARLRDGQFLAPPPVGAFAGGTGLPPAPPPTPASFHAGAGQPPPFTAGMTSGSGSGRPFLFDLPGMTPWSSSGHAGLATPPPTPVPVPASTFDPGTGIITTTHLPAHASDTTLAGSAHGTPHPSPAPTPSPHGTPSPVSTPVPGTVGALQSSMPPPALLVQSEPTRIAAPRPLAVHSVVRDLEAHVHSAAFAANVPNETFDLMRAARNIVGESSTGTVATHPAPVAGVSTPTPTPSPVPAVPPPVSPPIGELIGPYTGKGKARATSPPLEHVAARSGSPDISPISSPSRSAPEHAGHAGPLAVEDLVARARPTLSHHAGASAHDAGVPTTGNGHGAAPVPVPVALPSARGSGEPVVLRGAGSDLTIGQGPGGGWQVVRADGTVDPRYRVEPRAGGGFDVHDLQPAVVKDPIGNKVGRTAGFQRFDADHRYVGRWIPLEGHDDWFRIHGPRATALTEHIEVPPGYTVHRHDDFTFQVTNAETGGFERFEHFGPRNRVAVGQPVFVQGAPSRDLFIVTHPYKAVSTWVPGDPKARWLETAGGTVIGRVDPLYDRELRFLPDLYKVRVDGEPPHLGTTNARYTISAPDTGSTWQVHDAVTRQAFAVDIDNPRLGFPSRGDGGSSGPVMGLQGGSPPRAPASELARPVRDEHGFTTRYAIHLGTTEDWVLRGPDGNEITTVRVHALDDGAFELRPVDAQGGASGPMREFVRFTYDGVPYARGVPRQDGQGRVYPVYDVTDFRGGASLEVDIPRARADGRMVPLRGGDGPPRAVVRVDAHATPADGPPDWRVVDVATGRPDPTRTVMPYGEGFFVRRHDGSSFEMFDAGGVRRTFGSRVGNSPELYRVSGAGASGDEIQTWPGGWPREDLDAPPRYEAAASHVLLDPVTMAPRPAARTVPPAPSLPAGGIDAWLRDLAGTAAPPVRPPASPVVGDLVLAGAAGGRELPDEAVALRDTDGRATGQVVDVVDGPFGPRLVVADADGPVAGFQVTRRPDGALAVYNGNTGEVVHYDRTGRPAAGHGTPASPAAGTTPVPEAPAAAGSLDGLPDLLQLRDAGGVPLGRTLVVVDTAGGPQLRVAGADGARFSAVAGPGDRVHVTDASTGQITTYDRHSGRAITGEGPAPARRGNEAGGGGGGGGGLVRRGAVRRKPVPPSAPVHAPRPSPAPDPVAPAGPAPAPAEVEVLFQELDEARRAVERARADAHTLGFTGGGSSSGATDADRVGRALEQAESGVADVVARLEARGVPVEAIRDRFEHPGPAGTGHRSGLGGGWRPPSTGDAGAIEVPVPVTGMGAFEVDHVVRTILQSGDEVVFDVFLRGGAVIQAGSLELRPHADVGPLRWMVHDRRSGLETGTRVELGTDDTLFVFEPNRFRQLDLGGDLIGSGRPLDGPFRGYWATDPSEPGGAVVMVEEAAEVTLHPPGFEVRAGGQLTRFDPEGNVLATGHRLEGDGPERFQVRAAGGGESWTEDGLGRRVVPDGAGGERLVDGDFTPRLAIHDRETLIGEQHGPLEGLSLRAVAVPESGDLFIGVAVPRAGGFLDVEGTGGLFWRYDATGAFAGRVRLDAQGNLTEIATPIDVPADGPRPYVVRSADGAVTHLDTADGERLLSYEATGQPADEARMAGQFGADLDRLFGTDPARPWRAELWTALEDARADLVRTLRRHPGAGPPDAAAADVERLGTALEQLGADLAEIEARRTGVQVARAGQFVVPDPAGTAGYRIYDPDGTLAARATQLGTHRDWLYVQTPSRSFVEVPHDLRVTAHPGGIQVTHPELRAFERFTPDGRRVARGRPTSTSGTDVPDRFLVAPADGGRSWIEDALRRRIITRPDGSEALEAGRFTNRFVWTDADGTIRGGVHHPGSDELRHQWDVQRAGAGDELRVGDEAVVERGRLRVPLEVGFGWFDDNTDLLVARAYPLEHHPGAHVVELANSNGRTTFDAGGRPLSVSRVLRDGAGGDGPAPLLQVTDTESGAFTRYGRHPVPGGRNPWRPREVGRPLGPDGLRAVHDVPALGAAPGPVRHVEDAAGRLLAQAQAADALRAHRVNQLGRMLSHTQLVREAAEHVARQASAALASLPPGRYPDAEGVLTRLAGDGDGSPLAAGGLRAGDRASLDDALAGVPGPSAEGADRASAPLLAALDRLEEVRAQLAALRTELRTIDDAVGRSPVPPGREGDRGGPTVPRRGNRGGLRGGERPPGWSSGVVEVPLDRTAAMGADELELVLPTILRSGEHRELFERGAMVFRAGSLELRPHLDDGPLRWTVHHRGSGARTGAYIERSAGLDGHVFLAYEPNGFFRVDGDGTLTGLGRRLDGPIEGYLFTDPSEHSVVQLGVVLEPGAQVTMHPTGFEVRAGAELARFDRHGHLAATGRRLDVPDGSPERFELRSVSGDTWIEDGLRRRVVPGGAGGERLVDGDFTTRLVLHDGEAIIAAEAGPLPGTSLWLLETPEPRGARTGAVIPRADGTLDVAETGGRFSRYDEDGDYIGPVHRLPGPEHGSVVVHRLGGGLSFEVSDGLRLREVGDDVTVTDAATGAHWTYRAAGDRPGDVHVVDASRWPAVGLPGDQPAFWAVQDDAGTVGVRMRGPDGQLEAGRPTTTGVEWRDADGHPLGTARRLGAHLDPWTGREHEWFLVSDHQGSLGVVGGPNTEWIALADGGSQISSLPVHQWAATGEPVSFVRLDRHGAVTETGTRTDPPSGGQRPFIVRSGTGEITHLEGADGERLLTYEPTGAPAVATGLADLFGTDAARSWRAELWTALEAARGDLVRAVDGVPGAGPVAAAVGTVRDLGHRLSLLGTDLAAIETRRARVPVDRAGQFVVHDPSGTAGYRRFAPDGTVVATATQLGTHGDWLLVRTRFRTYVQVPDGMRVTVHPGGIQVTSSRGRWFERFDHDGRPVATGEPQPQQGGASPTRFEVRPAGGGPALVEDDLRRIISGPGGTARQASDFTNRFVWFRSHGGIRGHVEGTGSGGFGHEWDVRLAGAGDELDLGHEAVVDGGLLTVRRQVGEARFDDHEDRLVSRAYPLAEHPEARLVDHFDRDGGHHGTTLEGGRSLSLDATRGDVDVYQVTDTQTGSFTRYERRPVPAGDDANPYVAREVGRQPPGTGNRGGARGGARPAAAPEAGPDSPGVAESSSAAATRPPDPVRHVLRDEGGADRWVVVSSSGTHRIEDLDGNAVPGRVAEPDGSGFRVLDATGGFSRYGGDGALSHTGRPVTSIHGDRQFLVTDAAGGAIHLESGAYRRISGGIEVSPRPDGTRLTYNQAGSPRAGEYRVHDASGALVEQAFNVLREGRPTGRQLVVDVRAGTWRLHVDGRPVDRPNPFDQGTLDRAGLRNHRIRLVTHTGAEVFDRRPVPGRDHTLVVFRTVGDDFSIVTQRPTWAELRLDGSLHDWGIRRFDATSRAWSDWSQRGGLRHHLRTTIEGGDVFAVFHGWGLFQRFQPEHWTWTRYDAANLERSTGLRRLRFAGGWVDTIRGADPTGRRAGGHVAQEQGTFAHVPGSVGLYREWTRTGQGVPGLHQPEVWQWQTPQGKVSDGAQVLRGGGTLRLTRWTEQRPPHWVRRTLVGMPAAVFRTFTHLRGDSRFHIFSWVRTAPADAGVPPASGFRFVARNGATFDVDRQGAFVRAGLPLGHGNALTVGHDAVALPHATVAPGPRIPWTEGEGNLSGYRHTFRTPGAGGRVWEDRFAVAPPDGDWYGFTGPHRVARAGHADGSVTEFLRPPGAGAADGGRPSRIDAYEGAPAGTGAVANPWVRRDPHGTAVARQDHFPDPANPTGPPLVVTATSPGHRGETRVWTWTEQGPGSRHGTRHVHLGSHDHLAPFDESFRDTVPDPHTGRQQLVRQRSMLDDGAYVDAWRVDGAGGTHHWEWRTVDRFGNVGNGGRRRWWQPAAAGGRGAWVDEWSPGVHRFQDREGAAGAGPAVHEIPAGLPIDRVRRFSRDPQTGAVTPGLWREFDFQTVARERVPLPGGRTLEREPWLGQWRLYGSDGALEARRNDAGYVWARQPGGGMQLVGRELDFRGWDTEYRGWNRRFREPNRLTWAADPNGTEARYQPYGLLVAERVLVEVVPEYLLNFAANLVLWSIVDAVTGNPFNLTDVARSAANAGVSAGLRVGLGALAHDVRGSMWPIRNLRSGLVNTEESHRWHSHPLNYDKNWGKEWAGFESPTRWRVGTYDYLFDLPVTVLGNFVNGAMNASVFGIPVPGGILHLEGLAALHYGALTAAAGLASAGTLGVPRTLFFSGLGSRAWHRHGLTELAFQLPWRIGDRLVTYWMRHLYLMSLDPSYWPGANTR